MIWFQVRSSVCFIFIFNAYLSPGLSFVQREEMLELAQDQDADMPYAHAEDVDWLQLGAPDEDDWEDVPTGIHTFPPGEEAILQSHAGGEGIMHQIMEGMRPGYVFLIPYVKVLAGSSRSRGDPRTRSFRIQRQVDSWQSQLPLLVDAYLQFKNTGPEETVGVWPLNCIGFEGVFPMLSVLT